jgi:ribosomal silencing factor RsfS
LGKADIELSKLIEENVEEKKSETTAIFDISKKPATLSLIVITRKYVKKEG